MLVICKVRQAVGAGPAGYILKTTPPRFTGKAEKKRKKRHAWLKEESQQKNHYSSTGRKYKWKSLLSKGNSTFSLVIGNLQVIQKNMQEKDNWFYWMGI